MGELSANDIAAIGGTAGSVTLVLLIFSLYIFVRRLVKIREDARKSHELKAMRDDQTQRYEYTYWPPEAAAVLEAAGRLANNTTAALEFQEAKPEESKDEQASREKGNGVKQESLSQGDDAGNEVVYCCDCEMVAKLAVCTVSLTGLTLRAGLFL
jgi:hypothetical protein